MARKPKTGKEQKASKPDGARQRRLFAKHLSNLDISTIHLYEAWCRDNGIDPSPWKTAEQFAGELAFRTRQLKRVAEQARMHRNPKRLITEACDGKIDPELIDRPEWKAFCKTIADSRSDRDQRDGLKELLLFALDKGSFIFETATFGDKTYRYVEALVKVNDRRGSWLRELESWRPQSHNPRRQFSSLLRHLFCKYHVPPFMDQAWLRTERGSARYRDWFVHLGLGFNIRAAKTPFELTKKMAHHFLEAPDDYAIEAALRWGLVIALGGDRRLTEALLATPIAANFDNFPFWTSVIRFFIANPLLDRAQVGPVIDFLNQQKFQSQEVVTGPGEVEVTPPPQPALTMKGRTADSLLRQMDEWHGELRKAARAGEQYFRSSGYRSFKKRTGKGDNMRTWIIRELLSSAELLAEGRVLKHCVASYAQSCARGDCSIWTMELETSGGTKKRQTIEVRSDGTIAQCRGYRNAWPDQSEFEIVKEWAAGAGLRVGRYLEAA